MLTLLSLLTVLSALTFIVHNGLALFLYGCLSTKTTGGCAAGTDGKTDACVLGCQRRNNKYPSVCLKEISRLEHRGLIFGAMCCFFYTSTMIGLMQSWSLFPAAASSLALITAAGYSVYCRIKIKAVLIKIEVRKKMGHCSVPEQSTSSQRTTGSDNS